MATIHEIPAETRKDEGKGASRRLRTAGKVPAILYGSSETPASIQLEHNTVWLASQHEWFYSAILDLKLEGKTQKVLLRDLQRHPFKAQLLHLDFQRVDENRAIRIRVPLHFLNQEKSPAGKMAGVLISHAMNDVEIACLPKDLPENITVDLSELKLGDIVHLSDVKLPSGVEIPALRLGKEHDAAVVTAQEIKQEVEAAPVVEGEAAAAGATGAAPAAGATGAAPATGAAAPAAAKKDEKK
ncbi:MAG: 50S ribosomal protein L25/general stress protein Ctc [Xanthomonadaceae bacterium]|nr:50S ribosomal protein L25/general stress protein Ctc [Xanthomonadaceae bacterium]MDE1885677.1 50S ribosomal protein L25/general stress protein Ctc [Xanthomonadaceae bacterium]MDE2085520.1 50S ribosomal protein L25/general stress protein Ctc [Xanthomonadaceae bacterium]MDE2257698.1 50S ribosomal protein L25/general stress protein Ctc [Xanthomonadaceae bacterium]